VKWAGSFDPNAVLAQLKGTPQNAIIEQVPSGSMLRVLLTDTFHQVTLMLSGIQCAGFRRLEDGSEEAHPFAREARYFVETRLLNRDVQVLVEGVDKNGSLLGTVVHKAGNISVELVRVGLARVVDWSCAFCASAPTLRAAEKQAREKRLRLWKDYVPKSYGGDMAEYQGKVVEVVSGDTLIVVDPNGAERRLSLSSLRAPRMGREPEAFAAECKELARKTVIGKRVRVVPEYKRTFELEGQPSNERTFGTVFYNSDKNLALTLLAEGLALVGRHGQTDERAAAYEEMLQAEEAAKTAKKAIHGGGAEGAKPTTVTDLTTPNARDRAKRFISSLQRQGRVRAIVQFIPNGTRFKLLVPKENCLISFACVGIRCPQCARRDTGSAGEPFGDEALAFARNLCFQRDVDIEVETADKNGTFLGALFLPDKRSYSVLLLEAGLARPVQPMADRSAYGAELAAAARTAREAGLKLWENYSAEEEEAARAAAEELRLQEAEPTPDDEKQVVKLVLTEIIDGATFYAHVAGDTAVTALQERLAKSCARDTEPYEPRAGQYCCAKFSQDDEWYRAKVTSRTGDEFKVFFIDYGNTDTVSKARIKPLDTTLGPKELSPQAVECKLALCFASPANDGGDGEEAAIALSEAAWGKTAVARVEDRMGDALIVTLLDDAKQNITESLVGQGLVRVVKVADKRLKPLHAKLKEKEAAAKSARMGMWRFGDIDEDDDDEFGMRRIQKQQAVAAASQPSAWGKK